METVSYTKTIGNSEKIYSSDALEFYKDYWISGQDLAPNNIKARHDILNTIFPSGITNKRIVELGLGGEGGFLSLLKDQNEVFGFDASESAASFCQKFGIKVNVQNLDSDRLPLPDNSIDLLFAMEVFEHFASPQFVIEEIRRVLAPTGLVVISTPNPLTYHWPRLFYPELYYEDAFKDFLMINYFSIREIHRFVNLQISSTSAENTTWS